MLPKENLSVAEIVELGAVDGQFFTSHFFPRMARQDSPDFHREMWKSLDSMDRLVNFEVFRGGAKTSLCRSYTAKRISYGLSRTILYIGKSEGHAARSIAWIRNNIDTNKRWADTFQLTRGSKWTDTDSVIHHGIDDVDISIMGMGITGSVRGINVDDWRPDLIVLDDVIDDENAKTEEQREKITDLIYGAVYESLAPRSESPTAKMAMLQTPINKDDASSKAMRDPDWVSASFGCWTKETADAPIEQQQSSWPARWSSEELRKEKAAAIRRNKSSVWYREKECKLIAPETCAFKPEWIQYYDESQLPRHGTRVMVIDPVPPPSEREIASGMVTKDFECIHVIQRTFDQYYSVEYRMKKGHNPSWTIATMFELLEKHNCRKILVESVAYQRTLAWLIRQAMEKHGRFWQVQEFTDKRSKYTKIVDSLNGVSSNRKLFMKSDQADLIAQFRDYPNVSHDDVLETLALGVQELSGIGHDEEQFQDAAIEANEVYDDIVYEDYARCP